MILTTTIRRAATSVRGDEAAGQTRGVLPGPSAIGAPAGVVLYHNNCEAGEAASA